MLTTNKKSFSEFCQFLSDNQDSDISDYELSCFIKDYQFKINYYFHQKLMSDFNSVDFDKYILNPYFTLECIDNDCLIKLAEILRHVPQEYSFKLISAIKDSILDKDFFERTTDFLSLTQVSLIYKSFIIKEF